MVLVYITMNGIEKNTQDYLRKRQVSVNIFPSKIANVDEIITFKEFKLMYGMLFSLKSFANRLSPSDQ